MTDHGQSPRGFDRRGFLAAGGALGSAAFLQGLASAQQRTVHRAPASTAWQRIELDLVATSGTVQIRAGTPTNVYRYTGTLQPGSLGTLANIPGSHLGPILFARTGDKLVTRLDNQLPEDHIVHFHGLDVPPAMDGHPMDQVPPGGTFEYHFRIVNRAGTYWFHPHTDMLTAEPVYAGRAGLLIVSDDEEQAVPLPRGAYDIPLVIQDRKFDANNQFVYTPNAIEGFLGDRVLVNGFENFTISAATRVYRFRVINGSQSRIYKLVWSDGTPIVVIGSEGGLLGAPVTLPYLMLSPGERVELWADFRSKPVGTQITLRTQVFLGAGGTNGQTPFDVAFVSIDRAEPETLVLPPVLSAYTPFNPTSAVNYGNPRVFPITMLMGTGFVLNGALFQMSAVAPNEIVKRGDLEIIEITNTGAPSVAHPIHFHGRHFQVLSRTNVSGNPSYYAAVSAGFADHGWKDTVLVWPGERVQILMRYSQYTGLFLYHCHNLVHEDMGMMRNYRIDP
ncbi:MAG: multicopper oxidase domain-containing protein [Planctomycetes bacterium]|nr:multicopper oxidase domain-containing protein [Planctomycetota bacterium]